MVIFQSTLPVGGATSRLQTKSAQESISIHAPRGGSDFSHLKYGEIGYDISIHAPRGGSDFLPLLTLMGVSISIHAPRGGSDFVTIKYL